MATTATAAARQPREFHSAAGAPAVRIPVKRSQRIAGYLFVLPTFALFVAFVGWPIVQTIYLSLTKWSGFGDEDGSSGWTTTPGCSAIRSPSAR